MTYSVHIVRLVDGAEKLVPMGNDTHWSDRSLYFLTGGNFGCDCNRAILFGDDWEECGMRVRYTIDYAILEDGTRVLVDGPERG